MTPDQRMRTAATVMLLWDHPDRKDAMQSLLEEVRGTPLAPILDAYLTHKKIDPSPVGDLIPSVNKVAKSPIAGITSHVTEYSSPVYPKRRFAFNGKQWYCQGTNGGMFREISVQEVPYQCREAIFWTVVVNHLSNDAAIMTHA